MQLAEFLRCEGDREVEVTHQRSRIEKDSLATIVQQIQTFEKIDHPFIVKLYEVIEDEDKIYVVLEYMGGESLRERLVSQRMEISRKNLSEEQVFDIVAAIVDAMEYCHSIDLVHHELKVVAVHGSQRIFSTSRLPMENPSSRCPTLAFPRSCKKTKG